MIVVSSLCVYMHTVIIAIVTMVLNTFFFPAHFCICELVDLWIIVDENHDM